MTDPRSDRLAELTVVIPSYGRQAYLGRQVKAWAGTAAKVIMLDGSPAPWEGSHQLPPNIEYWHRPTSIEERFRFVIDKLETPYSILLSDDELYVPSALSECIHEISRNPGCVACKGIPLGFNWVRGVVTGREVYPGLRGLRIDQDTPEERVLAHFAPYNMATLWAVIATDVFKKTLRAASAAGPFRGVGVVEKQISLVTAWSGKCHVINELMWLRSEENPNIWDSERQTYHDWYTDRRNQAEIDAFLRAPAEIVARPGAPAKHTQAAMRRAVDAYMSHREGVAREQRAKMTTSARVRAAILDIVPQRTRARLRARVGEMVPAPAKTAMRTLRGAREPVPGPSLMEAARTLAAKGVKVDYPQLERLHDLIVDFHSSRAARQ